LDTNLNFIIGERALNGFENVVRKLERYKEAGPDYRMPKVVLSVDNLKYKGFLADSTNEADRRAPKLS